VVMDIYGVLQTIGSELPPRSDLSEHMPLISSLPLPLDMLMIPYFTHAAGLEDKCANVDGRICIIKDLISFSRAIWPSPNACYHLVDCQQTNGNASKQTTGCQIT
jgi:hypothetical protein